MVKCGHIDIAFGERVAPIRLPIRTQFFHWSVCHALTHFTVNWIPSLDSVYGLLICLGFVRIVKMCINPAGFDDAWRNLQFDIVFILFNFNISGFVCVVCVLVARRCSVKSISFDNGDYYLYCSTCFVCTPQMKAEQWSGTLGCCGRDERTVGNLTELFTTSHIWGNVDHKNMD